MAENPVLSRTRRFYEWEIRGRGWLTHARRVALEPPFRPFTGHAPQTFTPIDDGRRETVLSRLFSRPREAPSPELPEEVEPSPEPATAFDFEERRLLLPEKLPPSFEPTYLSILGLADPLAVEWVGHQGRVEYRLAASSADLALLEGGLRGVAPEIRLRTTRPLANLWDETGEYILLLEFGFAYEFMAPLTPGGAVALLSALAQAGDGELVVLQLLSERTSAPWQTSIERAVTARDGSSFFADWPALQKQAAEKCSAPLRAAVLRLAVSAPSPERVATLADTLTRALDAVTPPPGNALVSFLPEERERLEADLLDRQSHRSGMLASFAELAPLVALPAGVNILGLRASAQRSVEPPAALLGRGVLLGNALHEDEETPAHLDTPERLRHVHVLGATGTGKSTLLLSMIREDMEAGRGVAVIDPHGDLARAVVESLPEERMGDLLFIDPADPASAPGWNMLSAETETEAEALSGDLVDAIRRLSTSWGDQMTSVLGNAVLAILSSGGGTLLDLHAFLLDPEVRRERLERLSDPYLATFWQKQFPKLSAGRSLAPILTRLDFFLRVRMVRKLVAPKGKTVSFRGVLEDRGIVVASLAHGEIGRENASLLGSLLVSSIYRAALGRKERDPFFLYVDEVHEVATPSLAGVLTSARKFGLSLTLAHQDLAQLASAAQGVREALLGNAGTRIVFRLGEDDARKVAAGFAHFETDDLLRLGIGEAIARVGGQAGDFRLLTPRPTRRDPVAGAERLRAVRERMGRLFPVVEESRPSPRPVEAVEKPKEKAPRVEVEQPAPKKSGPVKPAEPRAPGRGGAEHQYLQALVKRLGEERGFRAVVEEGVPGGQIDVALIRDDRKIAVEISVTTTPEHEVANVRKCLAAGFDEVLVVSGNRKPRKKLAVLLDEALDGEERGRVEVFSPEEISAHLLAILPPAEETVRGYKVRRTYTTLSDAEEEDARKTLARIVGESLRRLEGEND